MAGWLSAEVAIVLVPILTLLLGLLIGYMAQRSGFCSIGGFRDLILFKQTRLFIGFLSLIGGSFVGYLVFSLLMPGAFANFPWILVKGFSAMPGAPVGTVGGTVLLAIIGGFGLGLFGVLLGGCPLRQMIMGSEGNVKSIIFFLGMCLGAILFHLWLAPNVIVPLVNAIFPPAV